MKKNPSRNISQEDKTNSELIDEVLQTGLPFISLDLSELSVEPLESRLSLTKHGCIFNETDPCPMLPNYDC